MWKLEKERERERQVPVVSFKVIKVVLKVPKLEKLANYFAGKRELGQWLAGLVIFELSWNVYYYAVEINSAYSLTTKVKIRNLKLSWISDLLDRLPT